MRVSAEPFTVFSRLVKHILRHPLLLASPLPSYKTFVPTFIEAITEFSNHQLYTVTLQPFSAAVNYLYLVVGYVGFFSCWTALWCFLNS